MAATRIYNNGSKGFGCLLVLLAGWVGAVAAAQEGGRVYRNDSYAYSFFLSDEFSILAGKVGDLTLRSKDGHTTVRLMPIAESRPGFPGNDPDHEGQPGTKDCDRLPASYLLRKPAVVAFSCARGPAIHYEITRFSATGSVSMDATYPPSERARWDPIISRMATSLKRTR